MHYHLTAPVPCNTAYKLRAVLPNGFLVKAGTSALAIGAAAAKAVADPAQDADGATWSVLPQATGCVGGGNQTSASTSRGWPASGSASRPRSSG